jgi:hypothetical protein
VGLQPEITHLPVRYSDLSDLSVTKGGQRFVISCRMLFEYVCLLSLDGIYHIVGQAVVIPVDISPYALLGVIVSQLLSTL